MTASSGAPLSDEDLDEAERLTLIAAVDEALADPRPDIPHETVRAEMLADVEELERRIVASLEVPPAAASRGKSTPHL